MDTTVKRILLSVLVVVTSHPILSQTPKRTYTTKRVNPTPPIIDGRMDDPSWAEVEWGGDFIQREPYEGKEPGQKTAFKILYDDKNLYVGIRAYDTEPEKINKRMSRRDNTDGDIVGIQLDSYQDHLTAFTFLVNAGGVKMDGVWTNNGEEDYSLDPIWYVDTSMDEEGWCAEMRIPLSQLRFGKKENHVWGMQVARFLFRKEELSCWQHIPNDAPGWIYLFGELHGISGILPSRRIELMPYTVGQTETMKEEPVNPFVPGRTWGAKFGLDGKVGVTTDLTMDFTVNPDFGQVEADPSVVNL
ncbi:MAG: sugar-binding protein, partial [bacterium]